MLPTCRRHYHCREPWLPCQWGRLGVCCSRAARRRARMRIDWDVITIDVGEVVAIQFVVGADTTDGWAWWWSIR
jgi:hypothetical protein